MSFLDHIRACNAHDLTGFRPFRLGGVRVGWVRHALAERLRGFADAFEVTPDGVSLAGIFNSFESRTAALARVVAALAAEGTLPAPRGESYPVMARWGGEVLAALDRTAVPCFGIAAYGVHVNGFVRRSDGLWVWVGRRSADRTIAPGKLDNLIAGGQPWGLTLAENLVKEGWEEAGLDAATVARAVPVGAVSYLMETAEGLKPDTLFVYDLELPPEVVPRNTDGEVAVFELWPVHEVAARVRDTDDFKFNVNLVVIDFLIRHGVLTPEEPDYLELVRGLHR